MRDPRTPTVDPAVDRAGPRTFRVGGEAWRPAVTLATLAMLSTGFGTSALVPGRARAADAGSLLGPSAGGFT